MTPCLWSIIARSKPGRRNCLLRIARFQENRSRTHARTHAHTRTHAHKHADSQTHIHMLTHTAGGEGGGRERGLMGKRCSCLELVRQISCISCISDRLYFSHTRRRISLSPRLEKSGFVANCMDARRLTCVESSIACSLLAQEISWNHDGAMFELVELVAPLLSPRHA